MEERPCTGEQPEEYFVSAPHWTPAPRRGIIPLRPLSFGTVLGRSFSALRHNPKVLFGFAIVVQLVVQLVVSGVLVWIMIAQFARIERATRNVDDLFTILAGTAAILVIATIGLSLLSVVFTAIVQGIVAAETGAAVLGQKLSLGQLWRRLKPVFWRVVGFSALQIGGAFVLVLVAIGLPTGIGALMQGSDAAVGIAMLTFIPLALGATVVGVWLYTKLLLTPATIVLEQTTMRAALRRSWRLTRRRWWFTFGIMVVISLIMSILSQIVTTPLAMLSGFLTAVIDPMASDDPVASFSSLMLTSFGLQVFGLVISAISTVVQSSAAALVYIDSRMRYEALDQTLLSYTERRHEGESDETLGNPFALDPATAVGAVPPPLVKAASSIVYYAPPGYHNHPAAPQAGAGYAAPGYPASADGTAGYPAAGYSAPAYNAPGYGTAAPAPAPGTFAAPPPTMPPAVYGTIPDAPSPAGSPQNNAPGNNAPSADSSGAGQGWAAPGSPR